MKKIIQKILKFLTKRVLSKQQPSIITVTGSIGKTSTKEGVYFAIKGLDGVKRSLKNYNNELGVPFTVALWNGKAPGKNIFRWKMVFCRLIFYSLFKSKNYPKWLVLEIGSDKPGDLQYLMEMIPSGILKVAVLTAVFGVHLEFFKTIEAIYQEKTTPFKYVSQDGFILVNADNCDFERIKKEHSSKIKVVSYGFEKLARHNLADVGGQADISAFDFKVGENGLNFKVKTLKGEYEFLLNQAISAYQCYPILAGVATALGLDMDIKQALDGLKEKQPMQGRMRLIEGINNSLIIDDTYNSSPEAAKYALKALKELPRNGRKIAVLGDMLELGKDSLKLHQEIENFAKNLDIDIVVTFGKEKQFNNHQKASDYLKNLIKPNDTILIKGSQGVRMERVVKESMAHPENANDLLVRQTDEWK